MGKLIVFIFTALIGIQLITAQTLQEKLAGKIDIVVAQDGSGDYTTFTAAIAAAPDNSSSRTIIFVKKGIYNERIQIPATKKKLTIIGEDVQETVLSYRDYAGLNPEIYVLQVLADDVWLMNLTIEDKQGYLYSGPQALALHLKNCDRTIVYHCKLFSYQDTWYLNTIYRAYAKDCFIEGSVDYIYGPAVAVFDSCVLFCNRSTGAVITAANTNQDDLDPPYNKYGFVFFNSKVFSMPAWNNKVHALGRPWREKASVIYYKCDESNYIKTEGWNEMSGHLPEDAFFYEFRCTGTSAIPRSGYILPQQMALAVSKTDTSAPSSVPCFDSLYNPNVIPAKRGTFSGMWNPEENMQNDNDSVLFVLKQFIHPYMDSIGYSNTNIVHLQYDTMNILVEPNKTIFCVNIDTIDVNHCFYPAFEYPGCGFIVTKPTEIPGMATIDVVAKNKTTKKTYKVYFDKDGSFTNADINRIKIDTCKIQDFNPDVFEYHYVLNDYLIEKVNKGYQLMVSGTGQVSGATVTYENRKIYSFPDTTIITVTAPDGVTTKIYTVYTSMPVNIEQDQNDQYRVVCTNPIEDNIECNISLPSPANIEFKLYRENGALVLHKFFKNLQAGDVELLINAEGLENGIYIYKIEVDKHVLTGQLVKNM
ncbi:MAG: hypothetical protein JXB49_37780 [Bacteroidales bacterium]|nr:hypothetical protein [Bacteroidales bacterium]